MTERRSGAAEAGADEVLSLDVRFACPKCRSKLRVDAAKAGQEAACTQCGGVIRVPPLPAWVGARPAAPAAAVSVAAGRRASASSKSLLPVYPRNMLSMEMRFLCPECRSKLSVDIRLAGREAACARCGKWLRIPARPAPQAALDVARRPSRVPVAGRGAVLTREEIEFLTDMD